VGQYNPLTHEYESDDDVINEEVIQVHRDGSISIKGEESSGVFGAIILFGTAMLIPGGLLLLGGLIVAIPLAILSSIIDALLPLIRFLQIPSVILSGYAIYYMANVIFDRCRGKDTWFSFKGATLMMLIGSFIFFYPIMEHGFERWADTFTESKLDLGKSLSIVGIYILRTFVPAIIVPVISLVIIPLAGNSLLNKANKKLLKGRR
jgi:hypothetical protein